jgi:negative regulator of flagellin synthesis FlgM
MKIGHLENTSLTPAPGDRKSGSATATAVAGSKSAEPSARVELSSTASQLAAGGTEGVFDTQKVQRISDAIRDGKFEINPEAIADKLIVNAQELLGNGAKS